MSKKITAFLLAIEISFCMLLSATTPALAQDNTITISSTQDFIDFAKNCTLDVWSQGKTVNLNCDIDFSHTDFSPVPTFGGTFNANGHTISGIDFSEKGSYLGIFRHIQPSGKVSNLNVKAKFTPGGSKSFIGGIAGENAGTIEKCSFNGTLKGENVIGGIAAYNTDSGQIIYCSTSGNITGENSTGGIAGKNSGFLKTCTNNASVNTVYEEKKNTISDIDTDTGAIIDNYKNSEEENEEESVLGHTDTGGVAGYSSGIISGCINNASVGYQHIGYNVGGIAGRQSGYMIGCKNNGLIRGRKDVGGIVGQAEPYIILNASENMLRNLKTELKNLNTMVNRFITDTDNLGDDAKRHLDNIGNYATNAQDTAETLINQGTDFIDDNVSEINAQAAILSNTLDKLTPVFDNLESGADDLTSALEEISNALDNTNIESPNLSEEIDNIADALSTIATSESDIKRAVKRLKRAKDDLEDAITFNNPDNVKKAVTELSSAIEDITSAKQTIKNSAEEIKNILTSKPKDFESIGINAKAIVENLKTIVKNIGIEISSLKTIKTSLDTIKSNAKINWGEFKSAAENIEESLEYFEDAMYDISKGLSDLSTGIKTFSDSLSDYLDDTIDELDTTKDSLSNAFDSLSYASDNLKNALSDMKTIIEDLSDEDSLEFVKLGDDFKNSSENLFDSLSDISDEISNLKNSVSNHADKLSGDLTSISNQFNLVMDLLIDEFENLQNGTENLKDIFIDASDENIKNTKQGKIDDCVNHGTVEADRNTGGITGAMAIEYSKDPEDDIEKPTTLNFTYQSRAVLQSCINNGKITGKKDCVGGIVGKAEIGTVYECENYGDAESTNGNYIGGIAGKSDSSIRKSYSKAKYTGKRYVGGIAGKSAKISASYSIATLDGEENIGAICGYSEDTDNLYKNFFVDCGTGAIDSVSFQNKGEPITFEQLTTIDGIPYKFTSFSVFFMADDKLVKTQDISYGESTKKIKYPNIPEKKGYFGTWQKPENDIVTENINIICNYQPYITILSSVQKNSGGKLALALAEGNFTDKAEFNITDSAVSAPFSGNCKVYDLSVTNSSITDTDVVNVRILNENKNKITAWQLKDGKWEKLKTSDKGKYVSIQTTGANSTVCLRYEKRHFSAVILTAIIILIIVAVIIIIIKKKKTNVKVR